MRFCFNQTPFEISGGLPLGGDYDGPGVVINIFDPLEAGVGISDINYTYMDTQTGCTNTATSSVLVNDLPDPSISGDLDICDGDTTTLTVNDGTTFEWSTGDIIASINVSITDDYSVTVTDDNGCTDSESVIVMVHDLPTAEISGNIEICEGQSTTLTASGGVFYDWNTGGNMDSVQVTIEDNYSVTVTDNNGCTDSESVMVIVNELPSVSLELDRDTFCITETNIELTGGSPLDGIYSGPGVAGNIFEPSVAGLGMHTLTYSYTDSNGCSNSLNQDVVVEVCTGVKTVHDNGSINVFPKPIRWRLHNFIRKLERRSKNTAIRYSWSKNIF